MRIAQVSPLVESVPPRLYGGTERVVSYLTEELVAQGHEVVLFASGDSRTAAELMPCCPGALRLARRAGVALKVAAKVDAADAAYFEAVIRPQLDGSVVEFVGEIGEHEKQAFLGGARALLFPIDWPEPFGLVMIEAMACGTPVIAWRCGSVPEVIEAGVTGHIVNGIDEALAAVDGIGSLDRRAVRARFESRFTAERMARDYVHIYRSLVTREPPSPRAVPRPPAAPLSSVA